MNVILHKTNYMQLALKRYYRQIMQVKTKELEDWTSMSAFNESLSKALFDSNIEYKYKALSPHPRS